MASPNGGSRPSNLLIPDYRLLISATVELLAPTPFRVRPHEQRYSEFIACSRCESVCVGGLASVGFSSDNARCAALQRETGQPDVRFSQQSSGHRRRFSAILLAGARFAIRSAPKRLPTPGGQQSRIARCRKSRHLGQRARRLRPIGRRTLRRQRVACGTALFLARAAVGPGLAAVSRERRRVVGNWSAEIGKLAGEMDRFGKPRAPGAARVYSGMDQQ